MTEQLLKKEQSEFDSKPYKRSRWAYLIECAFEYFVCLMVSDSLLATQLSRIGFSDGQIGIISSVISLAFLFSMASIFVISRIRNIKRFCIIIHLLGQLCFTAIYLLPLLPMSEELRKFLSVASILVAYCGNYLVSAMIYRWGNSFVEPHRRARYSAIKESVSLATGMVVSIGLGIVMDVFDGNGNFVARCIFSSLAILIFTACDFICLMLMKRERQNFREEQAAGDFRCVIKSIFASKGFRMILIAECIWRFAIYTTVGFLGTYKTGDLAFSLTVTQIINVIGCLARISFSLPFGNFSDRHSYAKGFSLAVTIAAVAFLCCAITSPSTRYLIFVFSIVYSICQAGINANLLNTMYSYVDSAYFVQASSIKSSISGIVGFCAALIAGRLLSNIQANGNRLFGVPVYGQQVLAMITCVICILLVCFSKLVLEKQTVKIQ